MRKFKYVINVLELIIAILILVACALPVFSVKTVSYTNRGTTYPSETINVCAYAFLFGAYGKNCSVSDFPFANAFCVLCMAIISVISMLSSILYLKRTDDNKYKAPLVYNCIALVLAIISVPLIFFADVNSVDTSHGISTIDFSTYTAYGTYLLIDALVLSAVIQVMNIIVKVKDKADSSSEKNEEYSSETNGTMKPQSEADELLKWKQLYDTNVITEEEYLKKKNEILNHKE